MMFDVFDPAFRADPYPTYARMRRVMPVCYGRPPTPGHHEGGWWYMFRYRDVAAVLKDRRFGRAIAPALDETYPPVPPEEREPFWDMYAQWTLALEPPEHTRQRLLLNQAFTAAAVEALRPRIRTAAYDLMGDLASRKQFDVVADYAFPLTLAVIADQIGIPHRDLDRVKDWSLTIAAVLDYKPTWDIMDEGNRMTRAFTAYLQELAAERRARPRNDLITYLLDAINNERLMSEDELVALCVMLLFAGHETTVNLISAGALLLLQHPPQRAMFCAQPDLTDSAMHEFLRLHSPIQATTRIAYADVAIDEHLVRRGESVTLLLGAANRDPDAFPEPDRLDITRRPNPHLAFGRGIHYCLGAPLALDQSGLALQALFDCFPSARLLPDGTHWTETFGFRGLKSLQITTN